MKQKKKNNLKYRTYKHRQVMEFGYNRAENESKYSFEYNDLAVLNIIDIRKIVSELVKAKELLRLGTANKAIFVIRKFYPYYILQNNQKIKTTDIQKIEQIIKDHEGYWSSLLIHNKFNNKTSEYFVT